MSSRATSRDISVRLERRVQTSSAGPSPSLEGSRLTLRPELSADPEVATVVDPEPGTWTVVVRGYINAATEYEGSAEGDLLVRR
jgi:hypothetical protein